jgi:methyl-accepting chemotaxis protein
MRHIKMKYRLLLVIFLPTLLLLGFLFTFVKKEYQFIQKAEDVQLIMTVTGEIIKLDQLLLNEGSLSKIILSLNKNDLNKELLVQRQKIDHEIVVLKDMVETNSDGYAIKSLRELTQTLFFQLELLPKKRVQIDNKTIPANDAFDFYESIRQSLNVSLNQLVDQVVNFPMTQRLYELLVVYHEQIASTTIRNIVLEALYEGKMNQQDFVSLMQALGQQTVSREIYYDISIPVEENYYRQNLKKEAWISSARMLDSFIAKGLTGPYGIIPQDWLKNQNEKMDLFSDDITTIINFNKTALEEEQSAYRNTLILTLVMTALILGLVLFIVLLSLRGLAKKLEDEVEVLSTSGEEILRSISEASSGMVETATAVTETTTTVEELKQTAQVATEKAKNVADVSDEALITLKSSETTIADTIQWMNKIHEGMGTISESILKLSEHSKMIGEIIDAVNDLAEQSHLLAVNAAIEAAKAGDQGKGFAVVAQEVRSLADQSKQATVQVRNILNDIQNSTNAAVMATEQGSKAVNYGLTQSAQTNESIRSLSAGINNVAQAASQISLSSQQQLIGVNQVTIAMSNIKTASDQQVDHMRQIEGGVQGMNAVGRSLREQVVEYKI